MKKITTSKTFLLAVTYLPYLIIFLFFIAYTTLSLVKHNHFLSGYDLGISDQAIWLMSKFKNPISTSHSYAFTSLFADHVEIIYALLSPIYWFSNDIRILLILQTFLITFSAIPIYLIAKKKKLQPLITFAILISFLMFYGIQNAIWADVHSLVFAASFLPWFIFFLEKKHFKGSLIVFLLLISCKEDIAMFTFLISGIYYYKTRWKPTLLFMGLSVLYTFLLFGIYYPHFTKDGYRFQNGNGLLSHIRLDNFYNDQSRRDVILYSFAWFGFLPLLAPLFLIPIMADMGHYFVLGSDYVTSAQSIFLHYRVTLASLLSIASIYAISRFPRLNHKIMAGYILIFALFLQFHLHLPLSYLSKKWFWTEPTGAKNLTLLLAYLPETAAVVSQNNITPHINHRELVFTLWPEKKSFAHSSPCNQLQCDWFHWPGNPKYLIVDTSTDWDARYWLTNRNEFVQGLNNLEEAGIIKLYKQVDTAKLYRVIKNPSL